MKETNKTNDQVEKILNKLRKHILIKTFLQNIYNTITQRNNKLSRNICDFINRGKGLNIKEIKAPHNKSYRFILSKSDSQSDAKIYYTFYNEK